MNFLRKLFAPKPFVPYQAFGEERLRRLVADFYHIMETDPAAKDCLGVHRLEDGKVPQDVQDKLFEFLSGWMGGPNLFVQKRGHPRMRARHMGFAIGEKERDQWLYCMKKALDRSDAKLNSKRKKLMLNSFTALALRIQNQ